MKTLQSPVVSRFDSAITMANQLLTLLEKPNANALFIESGFVALQDRLHLLPPCQSDDCYLHNTTGDAAALYAANEPRATKWQLQQVVRRLQKLRREWQSVVPAGTMAKNLSESRKSVVGGS